MQQEPGKRIISKGVYVQLSSKRTPFRIRHILAGRDPIRSSRTLVAVMFACMIGLPWLFSDVGPALGWSRHFTNMLCVWSMIGSLVSFFALMFSSLHAMKNELQHSIQTQTVAGISSLLWATISHLNANGNSSGVRAWMPVWQEGRITLMQVLPQLQTADAGRLTRGDRQRLNKILSSGDAALALAVLQALERVGDEMAIVEVRRLAAGRGKTGYDAQVRQTACRVLICLEERVQQQKQQSSVSLLRASQASTQAQHGVLLRAATVGQEQGEEQLLRATASE